MCTTAPSCPLLRWQSLGQEVWEEEKTLKPQATSVVCLAREQYEMEIWQPSFNKVGTDSMYGVLRKLKQGCNTEELGKELLEKI